MIEHVSLKGVTSYPSESSVTLGPLMRVNLIYGLNGSGKSTIANYLQDLAHKDYEQCQVVPAISQDQLFVYNQAFVEKNFHQETQPGIFTLNQGNIEAEAAIREDEQRLEEVRLQRQEVINNRKEFADLLSKENDRYKELLWDIKKGLQQDSLHYCFDGFHTNKVKFKNSLEAMALPSDATNTAAELAEAAQALHSSDGELLADLALIVFKASATEDHTIFSEVITPSGDSYLAGLIEKLGNSDWVKSAMPFVAESEGQCPLCQQVLPHDFHSHVKLLFDKSYDDKIETLLALKEGYDQAARALLTTLDSEPYKSSAIQENSAFLKAMADLVNAFGDNTLKINEKKASVSKVITLKSTSGIIERLNVAIEAERLKIEEYNDRVIKKDQLLKAINQELWQLLRKQADPIILVHKKAAHDFDVKLNECDERLTLLDDDSRAIRASISAHRSQITNIEESVKNINDSLASIGLSGFSIEKEQGDQTSYRLVRPHGTGDVFQSLSEGEKTLVTFLYFLELCMGSVEADSPVVLGSRVVVIDDPISSLSHNFVYEVAAHIYHRILRPEANFKKVLVLTHNLFFFHELLKNAPKSIIKKYKCFRVVKGEFSDITALGPDEIKNDYETYWQVIKDASQAKAHASVLPNMMRNVLEHYFGFIHKKDDLLEALESLEKKDSGEFKPLYRYINRESHGTAINITDFGGWEPNKLIEKFKAVFVESGYPEHYRMMMGEAEEKEGDGGEF
ncbi:AAA family ATPase [Pseudomonas cichorii]|nr:AAA family ATPase [Pseudomonas cichorii]MBX8544808.1 AAA family ATPase [Pseudomonas cichorii]MBX8556161.1 AAA family ATPase [Pseudomonas cichorii]MBX8558387.1 AAA family ATPase [Pseudomonas cichorii]MBX8563140.1 AAA family ATPase [Pseudomonas cichorii]MBX8569557.1 AAA family ATPase [Pseudomonas cichorii]